MEWQSYCHGGGSNASQAVTYHSICVLPSQLALRCIYRTREKEYNGVAIVLSHRWLKCQLGRNLSFYLCSSQLTCPEVYLSICLLTMAISANLAGQPSVARLLQLHNTPRREPSLHVRRAQLRDLQCIFAVTSGSPSSIAKHPACHQT